MGKNLKGIVVLLLVLVLLCSCAAGDVKAVKLDKKTQEKIENNVDDFVARSFGGYEVKYKMTVIEKPLDNKEQQTGYYTPNCYWICLDFDKTKQDSETVPIIIDSMIIINFEENGIISRDKVKTLRWVLQYTYSEIEPYGMACITTDGEVMGDRLYTELFEKAEVGHFNEYLANGRK